MALKCGLYLGVVGCGKGNWLIEPHLSNGAIKVATEIGPTLEKILCGYSFLCR